MKRSVNEVEELLLYSKSMDNPIVLEHHDLPEDLWLLGPATVLLLQNYELPSECRPTFNLLVYCRYYRRKWQHCWHVVINSSFYC